MWESWEAVVFPQKSHMVSLFAVSRDEEEGTLSEIPVEGRGAELDG